MYKDFKSKFSLLAEEETSRYKTGGGLLMGDYVTIDKSVFNNPKLKGRPSQFFDKIKEIMASDLPLKVSTIKSMRPETSNGLYGGAEAPDEYFVDVIQCVTPALWVNPITLPIEVLELQKPDGNNFAPEGSESWEYDDRSNVNAKELKNKTGEDTKVTKVNDPQRNMTTKNTKGLGKSAKDGRSQVAKPKKESLSLDDAYGQILSEKKWNFEKADSGTDCDDKEFKCATCKAKVKKDCECKADPKKESVKSDNGLLQDSYVHKDAERRTDKGNAVGKGKWGGGWLNGDWKCPKCNTIIGKNLNNRSPYGSVSQHKCEEKPKQRSQHLGGTHINPLNDSYVAVLSNRGGMPVLIEEKVKVTKSNKDPVNFDKTDTNLLEEAYGNVAQDGSEPSFVENDDDRITDIYSSMSQDLTEATRIEELTGNDDQASKDPRYSDSDPKSWGGAMARRGLDNPNKFTYHINLNERGSFYADVRDPDGKTVYEIKAGNELPEDETDIFEDGFMDNTKDLVGLRDYLVQLGILTDDSELVDGNIG
jgi:hypothetical protein